MIRTRIPWVAAALLAAACGAAKTETAPPPPPPVDENLLSLAPAAYSLVARIDVAQLRASPLWGAAELAMTTETLSALREAVPNDPLPLVDEMLLTGGNPRSEPVDQVLVLLKGRIDARALAASLTSKAGAELSCAPLTDRTIAVGTPAILEEAKALARREGSSLLADPAFADLATDGGRAIVFRFRKAEEALAMDRLRLGPLGSLAWGTRATAASGSLSLADGVAFEIAFSLDDPGVAAKARRSLAKSLKRLSGNAVVRLLGVESLLSRVEIGGENEAVLIAARLAPGDVAQIQQLLDRIAQIRQLMEGATDDEDGDGDPPVELAPPMLERRRAPAAAEKENRT